MKFTVDELLPFCTNCGGSGETENPILKHQQNQTYGTRVITATPIRCYECNGKGVIPTESGKALIEFFGRARKSGLING